MKKKTRLLAALIVPLAVILMVSGCGKPKTEAERTVEFLRDLTDEKLAEEFHPAYWEGQCKQNGQIWKNALKICTDGGPHHWMCDVVTTMKDCRARSISVK